MINQNYATMASLRLYEAESLIESVARENRVDPASIIDFSLNVYPFGPPHSAIIAAKAALDRCNSYPDLNFGELRSKLAARHQVLEESLFFGAGLDDVIKPLIHSWTTEGDAVLIHLPTFPRYELEAGIRGCRVLAVKSDPPNLIDVKALRAALRQEPIALAFLCSPNNPTGAQIAVPDIDEMSAAHEETIFIVDEALINPGEAGASPLARKRRNVVVLRTFSKYLGLAGLRIGYAIADPHLVRIAEVGRPPFNVASPSVAAAAAVLDDPDFINRTTSILAPKKIIRCRIGKTGLNRFARPLREYDAGRDAASKARRCRQDSSGAQPVGGRCHFVSRPRRIQPVAYFVTRSGIQ
jgi:histidinol-phosphate/aromatic aminotransferase/cobyric acid decarboxylase-like protein